jgi:hypothetical protein
MIHLADHIRARYETGTVATLAFFAFCLATAVYGFVRIFYLSKTEGWMDVVLGPLLFFVFDNRFRRNDNDSRQ